MPKRKRNAPPPVIPRFFCDNCGTEVPRDSKTCPKCGRTFSSVRCPYCDFVGEEALFKNGCPACGFSPSSGDDGGGAAGRNKAKAKASENYYPEVKLPWWVYILTTAIFTAILAALLFKVSG